jgi:hypothetical protein
MKSLGFLHQRSFDVGAVHACAIVAPVSQTAPRIGTMRTPFPAVTRYLALVSLVAACAATNSVTRSSFASASYREPLVLEIENHNWATVEVVIRHDSRETILGQVKAGDYVSLQVPTSVQALTDKVRIGARHAGGRDAYISEWFFLRGRTHLKLTIARDVTQSTLTY